MPIDDPGGNFDEELKVEVVNGVHVIRAAGPMHQSVAEATEMCVWVVQRQGPGMHDAIANAMGPETKLATPMPGMTMPTVTFTSPGTPSARWEFLLEDREKTESVPFQAGSALAIAIGVFLTNGRQKAFIWSEPVRLALPTAS